MAPKAKAGAPKPGWEGVARCGSSVHYRGKSRLCEWEAGHRADGSSVFAYHVHSMKGHKVQWTDAQAGKDLTPDKAEQDDSSRQGVLL